MAPVRGNGLVMLAVVGTLLPASFATGATLISRISFKAFSGGPVNPVVGSFEFQTEIVPSLIEIGDMPRIGEPALVGPTSLTAVKVNLGRFTTENVAGLCEEGDRCDIPLTIGATVGGIGAPHLGVSGLLRGADDFELGLQGVRGTERLNLFEFSISGRDRVGGASSRSFRLCFMDDCLIDFTEDELWIDAELAVSPD